MRRYVIAAVLGLWPCLVTGQALAHSDASSFSDSGEENHAAHDDAVRASLFAARVVVDPRKVRNVVLKVNARITSVLTAAVGKHVSRGEVLAEFDSAELVTLQRTYIETVVNKAAMMAFSNTGEEKLIEGRMSLAWRGLSESEIDWIEENRKPIDKVKIVSPVDGYIVSVDATVSRIVSAGSRNNLFSNSGATLFQVAGDDALIVESFISPPRAAALQPGGIVDLRVAGARPAEALTGRVEEIVPTINPVNGSQMVRIRPADETTARALRPGMLVQIALTDGEGDDHHD